LNTYEIKHGDKRKAAKGDEGKMREKKEQVFAVKKRRRGEREPTRFVVKGQGREDLT